MRLVRDDDAIGEITRISHFRSAESAVDDFEGRKIWGERRPHPNAGSPDEKDLALRRRISLVSRFVRGDFLLKARAGLRRGSGGGISRPGARQQDCRQDNLAKSNTADRQT